MSQSHRDTAMMIAKHKVCCSIYGINIKGILSTGLCSLIALCILLAEKRSSGKKLFQFLNQKFLDRCVKIRTEIGKAFFFVNIFPGWPGLIKLLSCLTDQKLNTFIIHTAFFFFWLFF